LAIDREFGNRKAVAVDLRSLAFYYNGLKQLEPALQYHRESREVFHELGDPKGEATQLQSIGATHRFGGQLDSAEFYVQKALSVAVDNGIERNIKLAEDELKRIAAAREQ
jgi:tetratricopeptide (TPR) repeat protein